MPGLLQVFSDEPKLHQQSPEQQAANYLTAGPFPFGGWDYAVFVDTLDNEIAFWKTNDGWATKTQVGAAQACAANIDNPFTRGFGWEQYATDTHPSLPEVYVAFIGTDDKARIWIFDLSTEGSTVLTGGPDFSLNRSVGSGAITRLELNYRLSNDQFLLAYEAPTNFPTPGRDELVICTRSGVWGTPIIISTHTIPFEVHRGMVTVNQQNYSRTHLFFPAYASTILPSNDSGIAYHRSLDDSNNLSTKQQLYTLANAGGGPNFEVDGLGKPKANNETGEVILPYWIFRGDGSNSSAVYLASAISAETPAWTIETVKDFVTNWNFAQVQAHYTRTDSVTKILFSILTAPELNDGREAPWWDQFAETWYVEATSNPDRIALVWREIRSGGPFNSEQLAYIERVAVDNWDAQVVIATQAEFDPAEEDNRIYQIDLGLQVGAAVEAGIWPERRKPRYLGDRS